MIGVWTLFYSTDDLVILLFNPHFFVAPDPEITQRAGRQKVYVLGDRIVLKF